MEKETKANKMRAHRREYWKRFKESNKKRIYGSLSHREWQDVSRHAQCSGRTIWGQIWAESEAYRQGRYLPSKDIEKQIEELYTALRQIATSLQEVQDSKGLLASLRKPAQVDENLARLEQAIADFVNKPWKVSDRTEASDDGD